MNRLCDDLVKLLRPPISPSRRAQAQTIRERIRKPVRVAKHIEEEVSPPCEKSVVWERSLDWVVELLFYSSAFVATFATWAVAGRLDEFGLSHSAAKALRWLATVNCLLAFVMTMLWGSELATVYQILLPVFAGITIAIQATLVRLFTNGAEKGRLFAISVLWLIALGSFVIFFVTRHP
jgi:hypothetical protein